MYWASSSLHRHDVDALSLYSPLALGQAYAAGIEGSSAGSSFNYSPSAGIASIAEYVERRHFMHRVSAIGEFQVKTFGTSFPSLDHAYQQVTVGPRGTEIGTSIVQGVWALEYANWAPVIAPRNLVALGMSDVSVDHKLNPNRDSCGMASHGTAPQAVATALLEFIERQTWVASWLGGGHVTRIRVKMDQLHGKPWANIKHIDGDFDCYLIEAGLPAYTVFATYFNERASDGGWFACGMACAGDPVTALTKALVEADHYRQFAADKARQPTDRNSSQLTRRLELNALRFQRRDAREQLPNLEHVSAEVSEQDFLLLPRIGPAEIKKRLISVSPELYIYVGQDFTLLGRFFVAKVFSPAFYLHCDPGVGLNFSNTFARFLGIEQPKESRRVSTCLP